MRALHLADETDRSIHFAVSTYELLRLMAAVAFLLLHLASFTEKTDFSYRLALFVECPPTDICAEHCAARLVTYIT